MTAGASPQAADHLAFARLPVPDEVLVAVAHGYREAARAKGSVTWVRREGKT